VKRLATIALCASFAATAQARRAHPVAEHLFFRVKLLIHPATAETIPDAVIETNGGKILRAGRFAIPGGAKVIDYGAKYVIPGLIDSHGHLYFGGIKTSVASSHILPRFYLAAGVTSVVNPGSVDPLGDLGIRAHIDDGERLGPRYFNAGEYIEMNPAPIPWMNPVSTVEEARLKIDRQAAAGASAIKVYKSMRGEILQAAIDQAHLHGLKVLAHLHATSYREAIEMGIDQIYHGVTEIPEYADEQSRPTAVEALDLDSAEFRELFASAALHKTVLTPTLVVVQAGFSSGSHMEEQKKYYSAAAWEELQKPIARPWDTEKAFTRELEFVTRASRAGCLLATGTDLVRPSMLPGFSLWAEMELFARAGLKPMEILRAATINGAYGIGRSDLLGTVETGKLADFVALDANPLDDISNVRKVFRVVKAGVVYDPAEVLSGYEGAIQ
jgi:imidazolonepropionase-like amidohydrolase